MSKGKSDNQKVSDQVKTQKGLSRRKFLASAAIAAGGAAATIGFPAIVKAQGPITHALAEHLAHQGHFPRVRPRLCQEGKRHDRRGPQDRGAAGRRRGAGLRSAGRGVQGHARRRPRRAGLPLRQAECPVPVGIQPVLSAWMPTCCSPGTSTAEARPCSKRRMTPSAPTWSLSSTDRWPPSPWAGSRSP